MNLFRQNSLPVAALAIALAACTMAPTPATLSEAATAQDWGNAPGAQLNKTYQKDVRRILSRMTRSEAITALHDAGYECTYGEAHEDYPEPAAQCTRGFATRACQMDWEIFLTSEPSKPNGIESLDASFVRDCVGTDRDYPEPVVSEIDSQLAPPRID
jgi:hypothetical protein